MPDMPSKNTDIVIFEPHPDDADWWTGGLTLLLVENGYTVHYACVSPVTTKTRGYAMDSAAILGVTRHFLDIPIRGNPNFSSALRASAGSLLKAIQPCMVFIPPLTDYHHEHVRVGRELFSFFHWSAGLGVGELEVYAYDSNENRDPIEIFIDISDVWPRHHESLACFTNFSCATIPDNTLIRVKQGRAMALGAALPGGRPAHYAEGYRLLQGNPKRISSLVELFPDRFYYRSPHGLLAMT